MTEGSAALERGEELAQSVTTRAAAEKPLLRTARAGVDKTHSLCDVASRRTADRLPTIILVGQDLDSRSFLPQIGELCQLGGSVDDILAVLDAAPEAGRIGPLIARVSHGTDRHAS